MRRNDTEITEISEIEGLLKSAKICHLALNDGKYPYIIPLCFGYILEGNHLELYFHSSTHGQKLDIIKKNNFAGFEIESVSEIVKDEKGCDVAAVYKCITGTGLVEIITGIEKLTGLTSIISKYDDEKQEHKFSEQTLNSMLLIKLTADKLTAACMR